MKKGFSAIIATGMLLVGGTAQAHVEVEGPGTAGATEVKTFNVGHGCSGSDTYSIEIKIPPSISAVRALYSEGFGRPVVTRDATSKLITSVKWTKTEVELEDVNFYTVQLRLALPNAPFTTVYLPTTQLCRAADGTEKKTEWIAEVSEHDATENGPEPAPGVFLLPARSPGWNKFTVPVALKDLSVFDDAQIVWAGNAAYSSNAATKDLISKEPNTTALTEIAAGTEIWVKY